MDGQEAVETHLSKKGSCLLQHELQSWRLIVHKSSRSKSFAVCAHKKETKEDVFLEMPVHTLFFNIVITYLVAVASMEKLRNLRSCFKIPHKNSERKAGQGKQIANKFAALLTS